MEPWQSLLAAGDPQAAWDRFIKRYRRLILATIHHVTTDAEAVAEAFAEVCASLAAEDLARLRHFQQRRGQRAKFSTWLVAVVRNLTIDWLRKQEGRRRARAPDGLSALERDLFELVFVRADGHGAAYERLRSGAYPDLSFSEFLKALRRVYASYRPRPTRQLQPGVSPADAVDDAPLVDEMLEMAELRTSVEEALQLLEPAERLAVRLFVVDELSAREVARVVGWPNAKTVYNRVYRALEVLRRHIENSRTGPV